MRLVRLIQTACVAGLFTYASVATAEVVLSESNDPGVRLDNRVTNLLNRERVALGRLNAARLQDLANLPATPRFERMMPETIEYTRDFIDSLPRARGGEQWQCLTEALYFEARGESVAGQFAVSEVILNRVDSASFPDSVCGVVNQGTGRKFACQFSYTCDNHDERIHEPRAYTRVGKIARIMLDGGPRELTDNATHYHTKAVSPRWSRTFPRTATIGVHHFYRMPQRVSRRSTPEAAPIPTLQ